MALAKTYTKAPKEDVEILQNLLVNGTGFDDVSDEFYNDLNSYNIRFAVILVRAEDETNGIVEKVLKPLPYKVKINGAKDRLLKHTDVEILIDDSYWENCDEEEKQALFDSALTQLDVVYKKDLPYFQEDGVVKLKLIKPDMKYEGFSVMADRYGSKSPDIKVWDEFMDNFRSYLV